LLCPQVGFTFCHRVEPVCRSERVEIGWKDEPAINTFAILFALAASVCWALAMVLGKLGLKWMGLVTYSAVRPLLGLLLVVPFGLLTAGFENPGMHLIGVAILGGVLDSFLAALLFRLALHKNPAHKVTALALTSPLWGVVAAILILGEQPRWVVFVAAVLVVSGAVFLVDRQRRSMRAARSLWGTAVSLLAGIIWGIAETVPTKYCLTQGMTPLTYQLILVATAGVCWGIVAIAYRSSGHPLRFSRRGLGIALVTAFLSFFLGWRLWLSGLALAPASLLEPVHGSMTLFAFLFSVLLLRERPSVRSSIGVALTFAGVLVVSILG
jgi:drug/metabolite transporter (DMT)-like permease